jgi:separase
MPTKSSLSSHTQEDMSASLDGMLQSLRLWNRAVDALSHFAPSPTSSKLTGESNPFEMSGLKMALPIVCPEALRLEQPVPKKMFTRRPSMDD